MGYRIQGAGGVQGELVLLRVYVELSESMTAPSPRCTPNTATRGGQQSGLATGIIPVMTELLHDKMRQLAALRVGLT